MVSRSIQLFRSLQWIPLRPVMPFPAHLVQVWLPAPRFQMRCGAGWPQGHWGGRSAEPAQACRRPKLSLPFSPFSRDPEAHSPLRLGLDGDRLFLSRCLDWRRPIGGLYRAPQLGPPGVLWWLLRGSLRADLSSAAKRLADRAYDGVAGFSWYDPTQPFPSLGS